MAYAISDFSRTNYQYTGDDGNKYLVSERTAVHGGLSAGALAAADGTEKGHFNGKPRHMFFKSTTEVGTAPKSYYPKKKIVFNTANRAAVMAATLSVDGLSFTHVGQVIGERAF
jgi:hypothetical protein